MDVLPQSLGRRLAVGVTGSLQIRSGVRVADEALALKTLGQTG
ncbi:MAG TPA: hypothetical protein VFP98_02940 [Candidatus Polarisedimenticolia bacterium]|nr:hypothetical protein [Candidatus Polarisedimenticolia bacterium]